MAKPWDGTRRIPEKHAAEFFEKITKAFKKANSYFWLDYGTLLGYVRDGRIIPHDGDIDLAVDYNFWNKVILKEVQKSGIILFKNPNLFTDKRLLKFVGEEKFKKPTQAKLRYPYIQNGKEMQIKICVEIYHEGVGEYEDNMYFWPTPKPNWIFEIPKDYMIPQKPVSFYGSECYIPVNYEDNLDFMYGKTWKTPNPEYTNSDDHKENAKKFKRFYR